MLNDERLAAQEREAAGPRPPMTMAAFEELDYAMTPLGELILRRREVLSLDRAEVFEVKLDGQLLMSSIVNDAEIALATFALPLVEHDGCDVLIGGLGLGYTAKAALDAENVTTVTVVEYLERVITWHERHLIPLGAALSRDPRCRIVHGDFFAAVGSPAAPDDPPLAKTTDAVAELSRSRFHAVLLDIDHSPQCLLSPGHCVFYTADGLRRLTDHLHPGGVFALWSADPPEPTLTDALQGTFNDVQVRESAFHNPLLNLQDVNYIIIAR
jgi:spermidine synthase